MKTNYLQFVLCAILVLLLSTHCVSSQNYTCQDADVLCLENGVLIYANCFDGGDGCALSGEEGPNYGCLAITPFPSWKILEVTQSGELKLEISQNTEYDDEGQPVGETLDVDFAFWGPFASTEDFCDFETMGSPIDCSYQGAILENLNVPNVQEGEHYILMLTNFDQAEGFFKIEQLVAEPQALLFCSPLQENILSCEGQTIQIDASPVDPENYEYQWEVLVDDMYVQIDEETNMTLDVVQPGSYRCLATDSSGNIIEKRFMVSFIPIPVANIPETTFLCDEDNDGFVAVELNTFDSIIIGSQQDVLVSYFISEEDAEATTNTLDLSYDVSTDQTIYAKLFTTTGDCFDIIPVNFIVEPSPQLIQAPDLEIFDNDGDGFEVFNLTVNESIIFNGEAPSSFIITYYLSLESAAIGMDEILTPNNYINTLTLESVYLRVENSETGCLSFTTFDIAVLTDTDGDGVADSYEDINQNFDLSDDDTDNDGVPNYQDIDDDGDTIITATEIQGDGAGAINQSFIDTDNDMIQNYLDNDDDGDTLLTIYEDYNGNGTPLDDDTNNNNIPDFLDADVALSISAFAKAQIAITPNPVSTQLVIGGINNRLIERVEIFDMVGKYVYEGTSVPDRGLEVSNLPAGIYFIKLSIGFEQIAMKFIKE